MLHFNNRSVPISTWCIPCENNQGIVVKSVTDLGFSRRGKNPEFGAKTYYLAWFFPKTAWKWKQLDRGKNRHVLGTNLDPPMGVFGLLLLETLLAFTAKYGVPNNQWTWLCQALLEVSMTTIALWICVCADDWAAELAVKASNVIR